MGVKVSVIIATYGAEKWIEKCARSLFNQTMQEGLEYIFVDDCSPDNSIDVILSVLEEFPHRKRQVHIIRHEHNKGVSAARTTGMKAAIGEYMIHCDPDDWPEPEMYETMYNAAKHHEDVVFCNLVLDHDNGKMEKLCLQHYKTPQECIVGYTRKNGHFVFLHNKMVKSQIIKDNYIYPPQDIHLGEDKNVSLKLLHYAKSIVFCDEHLYHYRFVNPQSLTKKKDTWANFEMGKRNTDDLVDFLMSKDPQRYKVTISFLMFCTKLKILRANPNDIDLFYKTYKNCRRDIFKFSCEPFRTRFIYACMLYNKSFLRFYQRLKH